MRFDLGIRKQQQQQQLKVVTNDDACLDHMVIDDRRDDVATGKPHQWNRTNHVTTTTIMTDNDESTKPLFRSTSPKVEYAASYPYYDVLLYSFTPEQEQTPHHKRQQQQQQREKSANASVVAKNPTKISGRNKQTIVVAAGKEKGVDAATTTTTKNTSTATTDSAAINGSSTTSRIIHTKKNKSATNKYRDTNTQQVQPGMGDSSSGSSNKTTTIGANNNNHHNEKDRTSIVGVHHIADGCNIITNNDDEQSPIYDPHQHQIYLELFRTGGDFDAHIQKKSSSSHPNRRRTATTTNSDACTTATTMTTNQPRFSIFAEHCVSGRYDKVRYMLENNSVRKGKSWNVMLALLETRETSLRLSPLLLVFCMFHKIGIVMMNHNHSNQNKNDKNGTTYHSSQVRMNVSSTTAATESWMQHIDQLEQDLLKVVIELLRYGASPVTKDICGRTVCFYGASTYATHRSLAAINMCCNAAMSAHYFGKEVTLTGLDSATAATNKEDSKYSICDGMHGLVGGYEATTGRRIVFLFGRKSDVAIANQFLRLANNDREVVTKPISNLCDVQDRMGHVCLTELFGSNRKDVIEYLLEKHHVSIDIKDWTEQTIRQRSFAITTNPVSKSSALLDDETTTAQIVVAHALKCARHDQKRIDSTCTACASNCSIKNNNNNDCVSQLQVCQRCMSVNYCSQKCQADHWTNGGHRMECSRLRKLYKECITVDELSVTDTLRLEKNASFHKPSHVAYDETFIVKVELLEHPRDVGIHVLHIYDKSVECDFDVKVNEKSKSAKMMKLFDRVKAESITAGTAIYLAASFDRNGLCSIYINRRKVKTW